MTTITLTTELERAVAEEAQRRGMTTAEVVLDALQKKFLPNALSGPTKDTLSEWEMSIRTAATQISQPTRLQPKET